jgi:GTP:adenosylcobinamide-phosphate guanylyltransferase
VTPHAVVIAAGLGKRLRPLTERYAKPVLPIDGKPVIALLLRELSEAGCTDATVVTGHLAEQVERLVGDGSGFGLAVRYARQASPDGSADAVLAAEPVAPYLVLGADKLFTRGDIGRFAASFADSGAAGAIAVEDLPGTVEVREGLVERVLGVGLAGAPLWAVGPALGASVEARPGKAPYELALAFQHAIDAGERVAGIKIGPTRDLTAPVDVLEENFPYLRNL